MKIRALADWRTFVAFAAAVLAVSLLIQVISVRDRARVAEARLDRVIAVDSAERTELLAEISVLNTRILDLSGEILGLTEQVVDLESRSLELAAGIEALRAQVIELGGEPVVREVIIRPERGPGPDPTPSSQPRPTPQPTDQPGAPCATRPDHPNCQ